MRGEHYTLVNNGVKPAGSSPHARGTLFAFFLVFVVGGIIPACAGNTIRYSFGLPDDWDHPRMRGEHQRLSYAVVAPSGSSPHARGTPVLKGFIVSKFGIIPACAGNTATRLNCGMPPWDHPRMRGEHFLRFSAKPPKMGSSPHARGTLNPCNPLRIAGGIIPACAGNTPLRV